MTRKLLQSPAPGTNTPFKISGLAGVCHKFGTVGFAAAELPPGLSVWMPSAADVVVCMPVLAFPGLFIGTSLSCTFVPICHIARYARNLSAGHKKKEEIRVQKITIAMVTMLISLSAWSQSYREKSGSFDTVLSVATGKVELDDADDSEGINSIAIAADFDSYPIEIELRYSNVQATVTDAFIEGLDLDETIDNWGIAAKLDLSWNCAKYCVYLMAGYNIGELSIDAEFNGQGVGDYSTDASYTHWGAGFRYDFSNNLRLSVEYLSYDIGKQDVDDVEGIEISSVDFGTATAWQAGIGYRF
jgi:opacity protein-like surface antigen